MGLNPSTAVALAQALLLGKRKREPDGETHLLLAIADHYEPRSEGVSPEVARARVARWVDEYPRMFDGFRDADGRPPRHTFFYPIEEYDAEHLDALAVLCRRGYGEVEVHLHHDGDTAETLRATLSTAVKTLSERHGLLARRRDDGSVAYGFVHGNWALNNARSDGRWCGVNDEIRVLVETGCYADFTFPSAPSETQPPTVNRIYYANSSHCHPRGHDRGVPIGTGEAPKGSLMLIPGPLGLNGASRKWGILPRLENACVQSSQPATGARVASWLKAGVQVPSRPDWYFVKLHSHGATEYDADCLLGPAMTAFHHDLARMAADDPDFHVHYVTTREMYNLARAAEAGWRGSVADARDFVLVSECGESASAATAMSEIASHE